MTLHSINGKVYNIANTCTAEVFKRFKEYAENKNNSDFLEILEQARIEQARFKKLKNKELLIGKLHTKTIFDLQIADKLCEQYLEEINKLKDTVNALAESNQGYAKELEELKSENKSKAIIKDAISILLIISYVFLFIKYWMIG